MDKDGRDRGGRLLRTGPYVAVPALRVAIVRVGGLPTRRRTPVRFARLAWVRAVPDRELRRREPGQRAAVPRHGPAGRGGRAAPYPRGPARPRRRPAVHPRA